MGRETIKSIRAHLTELNESGRFGLVDKEHELVHVRQHALHEQSALDPEHDALDRVVAGGRRRRRRLSPRQKLTELHDLLETRKVLDLES
jgi:hypothetical protein